jgi:hypothetical protein
MFYNFKSTSFGCGCHQAKTSSPPHLKSTPTVSLTNVDLTPSAAARPRRARLLDNAVNWARRRVQVSAREHRRATVSGRIAHVFAHRFVVETKDGAILADVTPPGLDDVTLRAGLEVTLDGELKPSELKVETFTANGKRVRIARKHHHHHHHDHGPADPEVALGSAREAGYTPVGAPRRKPKHFEVLARRNGNYMELHIELDGHIRKSKPADPDEPKWHERAA